jgi:exodeoxyribonuclease V
MKEVSTIPSVPAELNNQQTAAFIKLLGFVDNHTKESGGMFLLEGYAGTGKTYLISKFVEQIQQKYRWKIAVTAPTNKAVKVLKKNSQRNNYSIKFLTIHKLLGLKEEISDDGVQSFIKDFNAPNNITNFNVVICDEVSMLNDELFMELNNFSRRLKIIFVGDPAQIPPVGKVDSIPFLENKREEFKIGMSKLTDIMRQKDGSQIIEVSTHIRNNLESYSPYSNCLIDRTKGDIVLINSAIEAEQIEMMQTIRDCFASIEFNKNADYTKVIAWRNVTVNYMNSKIRAMIYKDGNLPRIMPEEKLFANRPIVTEEGSILFNTNDEFKVRKFEVLVNDNNFKIYKTQVVSEAIDGEESVTTIDILHEDSMPYFVKRVEEIRKKAIAEKDFFKRKSEWKYYYQFKGMFADVGYNYAITAHKSQGSTYQNTFVLESDIDYNQNLIERNRIKYTAFTRPSEKLYIVKRSTT